MASSSILESSVISSTPSPGVDELRDDLRDEFAEEVLLLQLVEVLALATLEPLAVVGGILL